MRTRCALALAPLALVAACASPPAAPIRTGANGVSRPATPPELFDGSYQGRGYLVRASAPGCPDRPRYGVVEIGDAVLVYPYTPMLVLSAQIARNGTMHGQAGPATLDGRIVGDRLDFTVRTPQCESRYRMHYIWNHS